MPTLRLAKPVLCGQVNADLALSPITLPAIALSLARRSRAKQPSSLPCAAACYLYGPTSRSERGNEKARFCHRRARGGFCRRRVFSLFVRKSGNGVCPAAVAAVATGRRQRQFRSGGVALKHGDGIHGTLQRCRRSAALRCDARAWRGVDNAERAPRSCPRGTLRTVNFPDNFRRMLWRLTFA